MTRSSRIAAFTLALATAPFAFAAQAADVVRASALVGDELGNTNGWQIARIDDVLFDPADDSVALLVLSVGSRFQSPSEPLVLTLPDPDLSVVDGHLRTKKTVSQLRHLSSLESTLESFDADKRKRLLSADSLIDVPVRAASGKPVGEVRDLVFHATTGSLRYVIVERPEGAPGTADEVAIAKADIRAAAGDDNPHVVVDDALVSSAKPVDENAPELQNKGFLHRLGRRLGLV